MNKISSVIMSKKNILYCRFFVIFLIYPVASFGQTYNNIRFSSKKVMELTLQLPANVLHSSDTLFNIPSVTRYCPVIVRRNANNEISNVGLYLSGKSCLMLLDNVHMAFLQRILLEILLQGNDGGALHKLSEYNLSLSFTGVPSSMPYQAVCSFLRHITEKYEFGRTENQKRMTLLWSFPDGNSFKFSYPLIRETVEGTDKVEADNMIYQNLVSLKDDEIQRIVRIIKSSDCIRKDNSPIYVLPGEAYSINNMRSDTYYMSTKEGMTPVFSPLYLNQSVCNLFMGANQTNQTLIVNHRQYGHRNQIVTVPLNRFVSYWLNQKAYSCYCGMNTTDMDHLETVFIVVSKSLQYIHMLVLKSAKLKLLDPDGIVEGDFYTNLPQQDLAPIMLKIKRK